MARDDEFSDSEDEGDGGRRNKDDYKQASKFLALPKAIPIFPLYELWFVLWC